MKGATKAERMVSKRAAWMSLCWAVVRVATKAHCLAEVRCLKRAGYSG